MATGKVKNWASFQHYKDRSPPWIKLHRELLDNLEFALLSPLAGKALPLIWLIASEAEGRIPENKHLAFRLRCSVEQAGAIVRELTDAGFLTDVDDETAEQVATPAQRSGWGSRHISDKVRREVWIRDGGKCRCCGSTDAIEYDHIIPVSRGGSSDFSNIQLLCRRCNRKKRTSATPAQPPRSTEGEAERETEKEARTSSKREKKVRLTDWIAALDGGDTVPSDDPLFDWAQTAGIPREWIALAWWAFEVRYESDTKTYTDWRAVFRRAVREDWLRLWRKARAGGWELTTAGEGVRCEMESASV